MSDDINNDDENYEEFESENLDGDEGEDDGQASGLEDAMLISGFYKEWFLDYASYVILERAVPHLNDGLKPVQRRILHSMKEIEDGRYNKVANVVGNTMKYHPHGDMSITDAMVHIGQKDLLIDMQGNWGNVLTGDRAAAARYIEARLTKFALEVIFNPKTTKWRDSYDGRNKEPETLPVKFPLLLAQGVEGIAVGLSCKILPHNFNELIDASIARLKGRKIAIYPDFPTAGMIDVSNYNDGIRGGKIRCRAKIIKEDKKTLVITEIPFGTTTGSLIDSILKANDKGKIKIKKVEDNTSANVEIIIHLAPNISPDKMIDALYAFTDCESSISPNSGVISEERPKFLGVTEILKQNTESTKQLLIRELKIRLGELNEHWHFNSLEKIFIENRIYRDIEECETWEAVIEAIDIGLKPYKKLFNRTITEEDIVRLTEIKIKRISKFDAFKADEAINRIEEEMKQIQYDLDNIIDYAVDYFKSLKKKFGADKQRKTEIRTFENIDASKVVVANQKLFVNREEGFAGFGMKKDEFVIDCSDIDDIIVFTADGTMMVSKIQNKAFFGKQIIHIGVWKKGDKRTVYNTIYQDGKKGRVMVKRFLVNSITRDKEYNITKGTPGSKVAYFTANPNGEAEVVNVILKPIPGVKKFNFDYDFSPLAIKGRATQGNTLSKYPVKKVTLKESGVSTLAARKIWYDETVRRLNTDERGQFLGDFKGEDKILTINSDGSYKLHSFDLSNHFDEEMLTIEKLNPDKPLSVVYFDGEKSQFNIKRFLVEITDRKVSFITEHEKSYLEITSTDWKPMIEIVFKKIKGKEKKPEIINVEEFISTKGLKAIGKRLTTASVKLINLLDPIPAPEMEFGDEIKEDKPEDGDDSATSQATLDFE
ncbi:MAG: DNA gyrase/topoisomerase IV subunit A [Flavobacteriales bacterium]|nr:DNA gyrase/topoisomerase IV subunit A [Flavobacteriales bacterium]